MMWKMVTVNTLERKTWKNGVKMHFSRQAHCQKDEKWSFSGSIFAKARLGFHFLFIFYSFFIYSQFQIWENGNKMKLKMIEKWTKNEPKMPTVNNPNESYYLIFIKPLFNNLTFTVPAPPPRPPTPTTPTRHHRWARVGTNKHKVHWSAMSAPACTERPKHRLMSWDESHRTKHPVRAPDGLDQPGITRQAQQTLRVGRKWKRASCTSHARGKEADRKKLSPGRRLSFGRHFPEASDMDKSAYASSTGGVQPMTRGE